ncbi:phosphorybosylanthranilate isomerase [Haloplanus rubicundus]|uniref:Phosphorybosylanthranilate isomerase n=2 Tax=Haloplanus rubicundus TaxID=1547898 RepID=A0A345EFT0_9EURY|nr:phosphorybosylanthranilate isomerase [Haloplanus rubicundus]AXG11052.1 phosphorybosylanthranilate isomerase [Haloplanus rubicundus]
MVHLPALPGAPGYDDTGGREAIRAAARRDAERLDAGGVDALLVENFGDAPFYPGSVPRHVVAELTALVGTVREATDRPVGVNVLRNDGPSAVAVAAATGAAFVRVNVHVGARVADQGVLEGQAHETMRLRDRLDADVRVLADVGVKHSAPLGGRASGITPELLGDAVERGLADGVIVSGSGTGRATADDDVRAAVAARDDRGLDAPVFVGSGVTADTVGDALSAADGVIVGSALEADGEAGRPVSIGRVERLVEAADAVR